VTYIQSKREQTTSHNIYAIHQTTNTFIKQRE